MAEGAKASTASLKRVLRPVLGTLALAFIVHAALELHGRWDAARVDVHPGYFAAAIVLAGVAMWVQLLAWRRLIRSWTGKSMPAAASAKLYLDSQMARYTPGKVGLAVVRVAGSAFVGVPPAVMGAALLAEVASWCGSGTLLGALVLGLLPSARGLGPLLSASSLVVAAGCVLFLVLSTTVDIKRYPRAIRRWFVDASNQPAGAHETAASKDERPRRKTLLPLLVPILHLAHFGVWIACGALCCLAVGGPLDAAWLAGALLCLAIVAGFVALLAPAGAGVREVVIAAGMAPILGPPASIALSILARVASLVSDVALWAWYRWRARSSSSA